MTDVHVSFWHILNGTKLGGFSIANEWCTFQTTIWQERMWRQWQARAEVSALKEALSLLGRRKASLEKCKISLRLFFRPRPPPALHTETKKLFRERERPDGSGD